MFKICPCCNYNWENLEQFVSDPTLMLNGYQVNFDDPMQGFFLFTHFLPNCNSTISIQVAKFAPIAKDQLRVQHFVPGLEACPKLCLDEKNLSPCPVFECPGSRIRNLLNVIKNQLTKAKANA